VSNEFQNRLRKNLEQPAPAEHPAPDVLNAYIEKVLPQSEEQQVLAHLAVCTDCREVVFLSQSAAEEPTEVVPLQPRRIAWWAWALPVAAVLAVASTVFVMQPNHRAITTFAPQQLAEAKRDEAPQNEALKAPTPQNKTVAPAEPRRAAVPAAAPQLVSPREKDKQLRDQPVTGRNTIDLSAKELQREAKTAPAAAAPAPQMDRKTTVNGAPIAGKPSDSGAISADAISGASVSQQVTVQAETVQVTPATNERQQAARTNAPASSAPYGYSAGAMMAKKAAPLTPWRVLSDGTLQHYLLGRWENAAGISGAFLTVSAVGDDVWVAGKNLALYHSRDNGASWERETLPGLNSGDILHIEFTSALNGVLKTSSGAAFSTHDGGKSWVAVQTP
jgi:photosynthesis system II assembly factor YCF48-like protein/putative zinc finger protein